jgi:hypothetical protein
MLVIIMAKVVKAVVVADLRMLEVLLEEVPILDAIPAEVLVEVAIIKVKVMMLAIDEGMVV